MKCSETLKLVTALALIVLGTGEGHSESCPQPQPEAQTQKRYIFFYKEAAPKPRQSSANCEIEKIRDTKGCTVRNAIGSNFGDTAFMRGEVQSITDADFRRVLAAAMISQNVSEARALLAQYTNHSSINYRLATWTILTMVAARSKSITGSTETLNEGIHVLERLEAEGAHSNDLYYLKSARAFNNRDFSKAREFAAQALEKNDMFFNALVINFVSTVLEKASQTCAQKVRAIERAAASVLSMGACSMHVAHLDYQLSNRSHSASDPKTQFGRALLAEASRNYAVVDLHRNKLTNNKSECADVFSDRLSVIAGSRP